MKTIGTIALSLLALVGMLVLMPGCATIMNGTTQSIGISSTPTGRAKVSPKPWDWERSHETGCCYPVGASRYGSHPT